MDKIGQQLDFEEVDLVNPRVRWFTYLNNEQYVQLTIKEQNQFEMAILDGHVTCLYVWEHYTCEATPEKYTEYEIDLTDLSETFQVKKKNGTRRRIYRIAVQ